ncbi:MAG: HAMP domain-containing protein [Lachnospiraceae bacterium]|nr:HAMP domain-containing protein [Lachnospiraceae bacterium]
MQKARYKTLRVKMVVAFVLVTCAMLVATWLMTKFVLPKVYLKSKINDLTSTYETVKMILDQNDEFTDDTVSSLNSLLVGKNILLVVMDGRKAIFADPLYTNGTKRVKDRLSEVITLDNRFAVDREGNWEKKLIHRTDAFEIYEMTEREKDSEDAPVSYTGSETDIVKHREKTQGGTYIDLVGDRSGRYIIYLSIDYESISRATNIATNFQFKVALGILFIAAFVIFLMCKIITKPIEDMSQAAERMCKLDFNAHCPEDRNDEIGELGRSLNVMSERLEKTIGDLKQANNELERDIKKKEEIESMRRDFISNVSHELKTPIALIQGYAEGLQDNVNDDAESRNYYCDVIIDEAGKMNSIVRKLLSLNQLEYGEQTLEYDRFDIYDVLRGVLRDTEILEKQQNVKVCLYGEGPCYVWADEYRIEEVVTNYISNAFHHVSRSKEIAVSVKKTDAVVRVSVYNTGEPIPEEDIDKIWIKFYKVDKARTREYGGTGIGLSVVKAVMDAHNQKCGVINHEGGVEFWFEMESADNDPQKKQ